MSAWRFLPVNTRFPHLIHASESEHQGVCTRVCAGTMRQEHSLLQFYYVTSTNITLLKTNFKRRNLSEMFCIPSNVCTFCNNHFLVLLLRTGINMSLDWARWKLTQTSPLKVCTAGALVPHPLCAHLALSFSPHKAFWRKWRAVSQNICSLASVIIGLGLNESPGR